MSFIPVRDLTAPTRSEMYRVFAKYYSSVDPGQFERDLAEKDVVLILKDLRSTLRGFSTIKVWDEQFEGRPLSIMFSGDTVIERTFWGTQTLALNWIQYAGRIFSEWPRKPLFWFLITKGHRTYRYLPSFAVDFYPDWRKPEQSFLRRLANHLAEKKFGDAYNAASGVVAFPQSHGQLADAWAEPTDRELARDDVQYFLRRNPGFRQGHELACVCELSPENLRPIAERAFARGMQ